MSATTDVGKDSQESALHLPGNLGKRKRTSSGDAVPEGDSHTPRDGALQKWLQSLMSLIREQDLSPSLLQQPLPSNEPIPHAKRTRLSNGDSFQDNIEARVASGAYKTQQDFMDDINAAASAILGDSKTLHERVNGTTPTIDKPARERIMMIKATLAKVLNGAEAQAPDVKEECVDGVVNFGAANEASHGQVLTLRSQTEKGPRQLFSGIQRVAKTANLDGEASGNTRVYEKIDAKSLPNGFDLADPTALEAHQRSDQERRTLGDVFKSFRPQKPLELPRPAKSTATGNSLAFEDGAAIAFDQAIPTLKADHRFARLPTGQWTSYSGDPAQSSGNVRDGALSPNETRSGIPNVSTEDPATADTLFQAVYSSFAPTHDNSTAVISEKTRNQLWWKKVGEKRFRALFSSQYPEDALMESGDVEALDDDFSELMTDLEPDDYTNGISAIPAQATAEPNDVDSLLLEVSEMLESLSSFQKIRDSDLAKSGTAPKSPTPAEFDMYEILKSQLTILVEALPPFAVAKLDGNQLQSLNIAPSVMIEPVEFSGTMEQDDFTASKRRASLAAATVSRNTTAPARPGTYQTPGPSTSNYSQRYPNTAVRPPSYNSNLARPALANYGTATPAVQSYQTPRPPPSTIQRPDYSSQNFQSQTPLPATYSQPTIAQFQRPVQPNGYGGPYGSSMPASGQSNNNTHQTRSSQPGYQQRVQDSPITFSQGRSSSPQKPLTMTNGHTVSQQYAQRSPSAQAQFQQAHTVAGQVPYTPSLAMQLATAEQRMQMERAKMVNQEQQQQSGTGGAGRRSYDGADDGSAVGEKRSETPQGEQARVASVKGEADIV